MSIQFNELIAGDQYLWNGKVIELNAVLSPTLASVRVIATGAVQSVALCEITPLSLAEESVEETLQVPQETWDKATRIYKDLQPAAEMGSLSNGAARRLSKALNLSERQLRRQFDRLKKLGTIYSLTPRKPGPKKGFAPGCLTEQQEHAIGEILDKFFLVKNPKSVTDLMDDLRAKCKDLGCPTPSESSVRRRINKLTSKERTRRRRGTKTANQKYGARPKSLIVEKALEILQIDHTRVDLGLISQDRFRIYLGRPWLTIAIDIATRCILGFYLSFDAPSATSTGVCLCHAVLPKSSWLESIGLSGIKWLMYGKPTCIHTDNGKDFWSLALQRGCAESGIDSVHRPIGHPHWGGHVERVIGTLMQRVHSIPGTTFSNVRQRSDYDSEKRAVLTLSEFREWLIYEIVRYHATPHKGLGGLTPNQAWIRARTNEEGQYMPPAIVSSPNDFLLRFLPSVPRKVLRQGVEFCGIRYWNDAIADLIGSPEKHDLHYDPRDISRTYMRASNGRWVVLVPINREILPISLYEYRCFLKCCRAEQRDPEAQDIRAAIVRQQEELISKSKKETRLARRGIAKEKARVGLSRESHRFTAGHERLDVNGQNENDDLGANDEILPPTRENWSE